MAFGRIFHPLNFKGLVSDDQAEAIAKKADALLETNCHLVFGVFTKENRAINFTTEKKITDTHTALLLGPQAMAALNPIGDSLGVDTLQVSDIEKSQQELIHQLQKEIELLRKAKNG